MWECDYVRYMNVTVIRIFFRFLVRYLAVQPSQHIDRRRRRQRGTQVAHFVAQPWAQHKENFGEMRHCDMRAVPRSRQVGRGRSYGRRHRPEREARVYARTRPDRTDTDCTFIDLSPCMLSCVAD